MQSRLYLLLWLALVVAAPAKGEAVDVSGFLLPMNCSELLPDNTPYVSFFESIARGMAARDRGLSKRLFRLLSLREKVADLADRNREQNPVDVLIRRTVCFYREQREPLKPIAYDDPDFLKFLRSALRDLEIKVEDVIFKWEKERAERRQYEQQLQKNRGVVDTLKREAEVDAERSYDRLSTGAKRKANLK